MVARSLMTELYGAFNPAVELRSPPSLYSGDAAHSNMTKQERIINGCMIRQLLERELPDSYYRILRLSFKRQSVDQAEFDLMVVRHLILDEAKIYGDINSQFVNLCTLNECWNTNLFRDKRYGPLKRYVVDVSNPSVLSRRRQRISVAVKTMKLVGLNQAETVVNQQTINEQMAS